MPPMDERAPTVLTPPLSLDVVRALRVGERVVISGDVITARDAAHARLVELVDAGEPLPFESDGQVIYYVGPSPARPGALIGSASPTTATRMDAYAARLMSRGVRAMIGKGSRSPEVREALQEHGSVYLAAIGGAAALLSRHVTAVEMICYEDLGTEAVRRFTLSEFPAIVANDSHGGDIYSQARSEYGRA